MQVLIFCSESMHMHVQYVYVPQFNLNVLLEYNLHKQCVPGSFPLLPREEHYFESINLRARASSICVVRTHKQEWPDVRVHMLHNNTERAWGHVPNIKIFHALRPFEGEMSLKSNKCVT